MPIGSPSGQLTRSTQIPTHARGKVRALVKAHKHWKVFLHKKGILSASAKNADLIEFALFYPELMERIEAVLNPAPPPAEAIVSRLGEFSQRERDARNIKRLRQLLKIAEKQFA